MMQDRSNHSYFFGILSMGIEPCQQIRADLLGIGLVEHFMASAGIELHGHIPGNPAWRNCSATLGTPVPMPPTGS